MRPTVSIECFQERMPECRPGGVVVAVDVIRATTTAVTAVFAGRRCFPVPSIEMAVPVAARLHDPLLVGELGGNMPYGFDLTNSPADVAIRSDIERPMILLSTTGTKLMWAARECEAVFAACLRNYSAQVEDLLARRPVHVTLAGAGSRGEFREEDQICCAWIAAGLTAAGYEPVGDAAALIERWERAPVQALLASNSVKYLRATGQERDLEFILAHVDDVDSAYQFQNGEITPVVTAEPTRSSEPHRRAA